jgi:hypothetical protein
MVHGHTTMFPIHAVQSYQSILPSHEGERALYGNEGLLDDCGVQQFNI